MSREDLPRFVSPMLLTAGTLPDNDGWAVEVKWDGCRAQARVDGRVCVRTRPGRDCTDQFPELADLAGCGNVLLLDGELVCVDADGKPDFSALRRSSRRMEGRSLRPHAATRRR